MNDEHKSASITSFSATMLYVVCILVGLPVGYLIRGTPASSAQPKIAADATMEQIAKSGLPAGMPHAMPSLEQLKAMADKKAEPLLQQLKSDPKNAKLLFQVGMVYESTHRFQDAIVYFDQSLASNPKDVSVLAEKASCLYYAGEVDNAIATLHVALQSSPNDARTLFNLGMMHWQGKSDAKGAIEFWQKLLKTNPKLGDQQKTQVKNLIKQANEKLASNRS